MILLQNQVWFWGWSVLNRVLFDYLHCTVAVGFAPWQVPPTEFAPISTQLAIKCFKLIFLLPRKKDRVVCTMNKTTLNMFYFLYFNPLRVVTGELEIEFTGSNSVGANSPWGKISIIPLYSFWHGIFLGFFDNFGKNILKTPLLVCCSIWKVLCMPNSHILS